MIWTECLFADCNGPIQRCPSILKFLKCAEVTECDAQVGERRRYVEVVVLSALTLLNFQCSLKNCARSDRIAGAPYYDAELDKRLCDSS